MTAASIASSVMTTVWCASYLSLSPLKIVIASSILGSSTMTGVKRRSRALSFSINLRYSSTVVAPTVCNSPRASIGFKIFDASMGFSAEPPAPTII